MRVNSAGHAEGKAAYEAIVSIRADASELRGVNAANYSEFVLIRFQFALMRVNSAGSYLKT